MSKKVKILVVGPCKGGKTLLSNILSHNNHNTNHITTTTTYKPTKLSRILWFEVNGVPIEDNQRSTDVVVELWDCSGDRKFEVCWPSMLQNTDGIIFVYDPRVQNQLSELHYFYENFARRDFGISDRHCVVFALQRTGNSVGGLVPKFLNNVSVFRANLDDDGYALRNRFKRFLAVVVLEAKSGRNSMLTN